MIPALAAGVAVAVIIWQRREIARLTLAVDYLRGRLREVEARLWWGWSA